MRSNPLPILALLAPAFLLAGCAAEKSEEATAAADSAAVDTQASGPDVAGPVAPGVAFRFDYSFSLPAKAVSQVQQQHVAACQRLGPNRCRITGMNYEQPREDEVAARLDLLLAPDVAHAFGNEVIEAVEKAEGKLETASVSGENAGDQIRLSQEDSAAIEAEIARIEARLAAKGLTERERVELRQQISALREKLRGQASERKQKEASIASTPVSLSYASQGILAGDGTFTKAASASWSSLEGMLALLSLALGTALPWLALVGGIVLAWRFARRAHRMPASAPKE